MRFINTAAVKSLNAQYGGSVEGSRALVLLMFLLSDIPGIKETR